MVAPNRKSKLLYCDRLVFFLSASNVVLFVLLLSVSQYAAVPPRNEMISKEMAFHGGHPLGKMHGSCYCNGGDGYCMCNPALAIDVVIFSGTKHMWLVRRKDTQQLATMGGFVDIGESVQEAVARELKEEMGLSLTKPPVLFGVFSDPRRDNRRHTASAVFAVHLDGSEVPTAADDVKAVERIAIADFRKLESKNLFADHFTIIHDYLNLLDGKKSTSDFTSSKGDFTADVHRSICIPLDMTQPTN